MTTSIASVVLVALLAPSVTPDLVGGGAAETTAGRIPIGDAGTAEIATIAVIPAIGGMLTASDWSARLDYMPRFFLRFPREPIDVERPLLLNQFTAELQTTLTSSMELALTSYANFGESDYTQTSLLLEQVTGQPPGNQGIPPAGILLTNAVGGGLALTTNLEGGQRLINNADLSYTEVLSTAEGMTGENNPYPTQIRAVLGSTFIHQLTILDELSIQGHFTWVDIGSSMLTRTSTAIRTADLFGVLNHRFSPDFSASITAGASIQIEGLAPLPLVGLGMLYSHAFTPSWRLNFNSSLMLQGFVDPTQAAYQPRATLTISPALTSRDLTATITFIAYTAAYQFDPAEAPPGAARTETGITVSTPVTYYLTDELSVVASLRASMLATHLQHPDFSWRDGELIGSLSVNYTVSTADTPTARASVR